MNDVREGDQFASYDMMNEQICNLKFASSRERDLD